MRILVVLVLISAPLLASSDQETLPTCDDVTLDMSVEEKLAPILLGLLEARRTGDLYLPEYVGPLHDLFRDKDAVAMEARVALLGYYIGEHYGEELVCAVSQDGEAARALIERYRRCRPKTSSEPDPPPVYVPPIMLGNRP